MKQKITNAILILIFIIGLSLLLYPTISDYWNSFHMTRTVAEYNEVVENMNDEDAEKMLKQAEKYNKKLKKRAFGLAMEGEELAEYNRILDVTGTGIMGYIEIPTIKCKLPIYHGTEENVLQVAVGHLTGTSMPVGGTGTHCVISGHRGLPSAKLFTDIDKLTEGDIFIIRTLTRIMTYQVDQIRVVLPAEVGDLQIDSSKDLFTLVTCTPYGINTHRLLIRGHRVPNSPDLENIYVNSEAMLMDIWVVAVFIAVPIIVLLIIVMLIKTGRKKRTGGNSDDR